MLAAMALGSRVTFANRVVLNQGSISGPGTLPVDWTVHTGVTTVYWSFTGASGYAHDSAISGSNAPGAGGAGGAYRVALASTPGHVYRVSRAGGDTSPAMWTIDNLTTLEQIALFYDGASTLTNGGIVGTAQPNGGAGGSAQFNVAVPVSATGGAGGAGNASGVGANGGNGSVVAVPSGGVVFSGGGGGGGGDVSPLANGGTGGSTGTIAGQAFSGSMGGGGASMFSPGNSGFSNPSVFVYNNFVVVEYA